MGKVLFIFKMLICINVKVYYKDVLVFIGMKVMIFWYIDILNILIFICVYVVVNFLIWF